MEVTRQDKAQNYEKKTMQRSGTKGGNKKGLNSKTGNEKELVDRKRALGGKVEGLYIGKEQETFEEGGKQSVNKGGLSKAVRKVMGRGLNWNDEWEQEEGLVVRELGRRMLPEEWSIREEAPVKDRRLTGTEFTTFGCGSKNTIAPELGQIQSISSYIDLAKCNFDESTKAALVCAHYKCVTKIVKSAPLLDTHKPDAGLNWTGRALVQAVPIQGSHDIWVMSKFSHAESGGRLTPERVRELKRGSLYWPNVKETLLAVPNREYALSSK